MSGEDRFDFDWLVIGSGFGGSVAALRLCEKGYRVGVLECGRRFSDDEFADSTWDARRYFWMPKLGCKGVLRLTLFKDVLIASGCGVGGGSLGYANTLYVPPHEFFDDPQWRELRDWESALAPHYAEAQRMLGVVDYDRDDQPGLLLKRLAGELGVPIATGVRAWACSSASPARRCQTRSSAERGLTARVACGVGGACSAARTARRIRWSRIICGLPSAWARG